MLVSLSRNRIEAAAAIAAREQAFTDERGVLGVRTRLDGDTGYTGHWDLSAVLEHLHRAVALQWRGEELTTWVSGEIIRHFAIIRPGAQDENATQLDLLATEDLDEVLRLAGQIDARNGLWTICRSKGGVVFAVQATTKTQARVDGWVMMCPAPGCGGDPGVPCESKTGAEHHASVHDRDHHNGVLTAEVASLSALAASLLAAPTPVPRVAAMGWEVDAPDGRRLYLGEDLELAQEIYHASPPGSHLLPAAPARTTADPTPPTEAASGLPVLVGGGR